MTTLAAAGAMYWAWLYSEHHGGFRLAMAIMMGICSLVFAFRDENREREMERMRWDD